MEATTPNGTKEVGLIVLANLIVLTIGISVMGVGVWILYVQPLFSFAYGRKFKQNVPLKTYVYLEDGIFIVNGAFKKFRMERSEIASVTYSRNLLANIFDWDLVTIQPKSGKTVRIYVNRGYQP